MNCCLAICLHAAVGGAVDATLGQFTFNQIISTTFTIQDCVFARNGGDCDSAVFERTNEDT